MNKIDPFLWEKVQRFQEIRMTAVRFAVSSEIHEDDMTVSVSSRSVRADSVHGIDRQLREIGQKAIDGRQPVSVCLNRYCQLLPIEKWQPVFVYAETEAAFDRMASAVRALGYPQIENPHARGKASSDAFRMFRVLHVRTPPDENLIKPLTDLDDVFAVYDADRGYRLHRPAQPGLAPLLHESPAMIRAPGRNFPVQGEGAVICILDTGIDPNHPDFQGRITLARDFSDDGNERDMNGHGTHCAGIAAGDGTASDGRYTGIAPKSGLLSGKILNRKGEGRFDWMLNGIGWAVQNGASVINISVGVNGIADGRSIMSLACDEAVRRGVIVCVAAGNDGPANGTILIPGDSSLAITVAAVDRNLRPAEFSARGPTANPDHTGRKPTISAPGVDITAARSSEGAFAGLPENPMYIVLSGTSMACPHAAGCAAMAVSYARFLGLNSFTPKLFAELMTDASEPIPGIDPEQVGSGLISLTPLLEKLPGLLNRKSEPVRKDNVMTVYCAEDRRLIPERAARHVCPTCNQRFLCDDCFHKGITRCPVCRTSEPMPKGALSPQQCRYFETLYLEKAARKLAEMNPNAVPNLLTGKTCTVKNWAKLRESGTREDAIRQLADSYRQSSGIRRDIGDFPKDEWRLYRIGKGMVFSNNKGHVAVRTVSLSPIRELIEKGYAVSPLREGDINRFLDETGVGRSADQVFHYIGIFSPTGWDSSLTANASAIPSGPNFRLFLIETESENHWKICGTAESKAKDVKDLFDPMTMSDYTFLIENYMDQENLLILGPVLASRMAVELGLPVDLAIRAFREIAGHRNDLICEERKGEVILRRKDG